MLFPGVETAEGGLKPPRLNSLSGGVGGLLARTPPKPPIGKNLGCNDFFLFRSYNPML